MDDRPQPDAEEKRIRFGCGFIAGGVVAFLFAFQGVAASTGTFWAIVISGALVFALFAVRYGDDAWHGLIRLLSWIWRW